MGLGGEEKLSVASCYLETGDVPACQPPGSYADLAFYLYPLLLKTTLKIYVNTFVYIG